MLARAFMPVKIRYDDTINDGEVGRSRPIVDFALADAVCRFFIFGVMWFNALDNAYTQHKSQSHIHK